jgi:hypothetical protein
MSETATEVPREKWGEKRPYIIPPGGGEPELYERPSGFGKLLEDRKNLERWQERKTAEGLLKRPDLQTRVAGILANGDPNDDWETKKALDKVCGEAKEAAGAFAGASSGTGFHSLTEAIDRGLEPLFVPEADKPRLDDYRRALRGYKALDVEVFCVNDEVRAAGTFDRLLLCPDGRVRVADLKSGKSEAAFPFSTSVQISVYAHASRYDPETGERTPLHAALDLTTGLLIHLPPSGGCTVIPLDIELGWEAAQLATRVRAMRALKADDIIRRDSREASA